MKWNDLQDQMGFEHRSMLQLYSLRFCSPSESGLVFIFMHVSFE